MKTGDVVQLKSGGPKMTVDSLDLDTGKAGSFAECVWFDRDQRLVSGAFWLGMLSPVTPDAKPPFQQQRRACACGHKMGGHNGEGICLARLPTGEPCANTGKCKIIEATEE